MKRRYSRLNKIEQRKNIRRAFLYSLLTITACLLFIFFGIPSVAKFASFLTEIRTSNVLLEKNDTTPPIIPTLDLLPESTNEKEVEVSGSTEPGAIVILFINNKEEEFLTNKEGKFFTKITLRNGTNTISALAKDSAGNESQKSDTIKVIFDNEPPSLEITSPEDGSEYYGSKQRQVVIEGASEAGVSVNINERIVVVESDGKFTFLTTLSEGENKFSVKAEDKAKNLNEKSFTLYFTP